MYLLCISKGADFNKFIWIFLIFKLGNAFSLLSWKSLLIFSSSLNI